MREFRPTNFDTDYKRKFDELVSDDDDSDEDSDDSDKKGAGRKAAAAQDSDDEWNNVADDRQA